MTAPDVTSPAGADAPVTSWRDSLAVYLQPRVLIVLFLGFSSGLPLALSGSTLLVWMRESGVDLGTIGLFALVGTPYTLKFLWAPLVDALHVPLFTRAFGRRRGWLLFSPPSPSNRRGPKQRHTPRRPSRACSTRRSAPSRNSCRARTRSPRSPSSCCSSSPTRSPAP